MTQSGKGKRIAVLTSGGDAPGMNAAIRAVVRVGHYYGAEVFGVQRGYAGLVNDEFIELKPRSVSNTIQLGGTILKTSRCKEFRTEEGREKAKENLEKHEIDGLIVIGGNGSFQGATLLANHWSGNIIGVPGTIDNDIYGTDFTIGFDTAVNTALEAIDKIRDTADAHERFFVIEVMGRHAGHIALEVGIGGGAEEVLLPETRTNIDALSSFLLEAQNRGKTSSILVVAEGDEEGGAFEVADKIKKQCGIEYRVVVLGHLQRGGSPTAADRLAGTELGAYAVELFLLEETGVMAGKIGGSLVATPLHETWEKKKPLDPWLVRYVPILAT